MKMATGNLSRTHKMNVQDQQDFSDIRDSVSIAAGHYFLAASVLFFQLVNYIVRSHGPPKFLTDEEWKWRNLYVSWVHSLIASAWVVTCTFLYPELYDNLLQHINQLTYFCVCFSTGYFVYDFMDVLVNNKMSSLWQVGVHHFTVAGMFYYNLQIKQQIAFNIVALMVEINSIFLHWRKLLQMTKTPFDSPKYLIVKYLNLVSFVLFRGGPLVIISVCCVIWRHKVSLTYWLGISVTTFLMDILNIILFWRLLKSDVLRGRATLGQSAMSSNHGNIHMLIGNNFSSDSVKTRKNNH